MSEPLRLIGGNEGRSTSGPVVALLHFPGSNCDRETALALRAAGAHVVDLDWRAEELPAASGVVLPGGFSYGDYLRPGAMAARAPIMEAVRRFAAAGGAVLGICNGFQILTEAGLLPGALRRNRGGRFVCRTVHLRLEKSGRLVSLPVAHADGSYLVAADQLDVLRSHGQILMRYASPTDELDDCWNPNGSSAAIAAVCNRAGNVIGMMPHPERAALPWQQGGDGLYLLRSWLEVTCDAGRAAVTSPSQLLGRA